MAPSGGAERVEAGARFSSGRVFVINTRAQRKLLHIWILLVIVKQHLVHIGRIDRATEYFSAPSGGAEKVEAGARYPKPRANMAHTRQTRPDSGLGFKVKVSKTF